MPGLVITMAPGTVAVPRKQAAGLSAGCVAGLVFREGRPIQVRVLTRLGRRNDKPLEGAPRYRGP